MQNNWAPNFYYILPIDPSYPLSTPPPSMNYHYYPYPQHNSTQVFPQFLTQPSQFPPNHPNPITHSPQSPPKYKTSQTKRNRITENSNHSYIPSLTLTSRKKKNQVEKIIEKQWDRNLASNVFKIYLKYVRQDIAKEEGFIRKLILSFKGQYSVEEFVEHLKKHLNPELNYIRPEFVKKICKNQNGQYDALFSKVIRISIHNFFKAQIFMMNSTRDKPKKIVREEHIKAGTKLLRNIQEACQKSS